MNHTAETIRIAIADDHAMLRCGLAHTFSLQKDFLLVASVADGVELVAAVEQYRPQVVVTDLRMARMHGLQACALIKEKWPDTEIVTYSSYDSGEFVCRLRAIGVRGYLIKTGDGDEVCKAVRAVYNGCDYYSASIRNRMSGYFRTGAMGSGRSECKDRFTQTELQVMELFRQGDTAKEIGGKLRIKERTVQMHKEKIEEKTGVRGAVGIAVYATENWLRHE